jgi:hypothetical protein
MIFQRRQQRIAVLVWKAEKSKEFDAQSLLATVGKEEIGMRGEKPFQWARN